MAEHHFVTAAPSVSCEFWKIKCVCSGAVSPEATALIGQHNTDLLVRLRAQVYLSGTPVITLNTCVTNLGI